VRALRFLLALVAALLAHLVLVAAVPEVIRVVDFFLLVIVVQTMTGNVLMSMLAGALVGLTQDAVTGGLYGLHGFAGTVVGYAMARAAQLLSLQKSYYVALFFASAVLLQQLVLQGLLVVLLQRPELPTVTELAFRVGIAAPLGALIVSLSDRIADSWSLWRRSHRPRVSLE
jgi:rod shape-determining protein MreD